MKLPLTWDFLIVAWILASAVLGLLALNTLHGSLTVEVVPANQSEVPIPKVGDTVLVYGTWVRDIHFIDALSWNEIHPAVYLYNNSTGAEGGTLQCRMLENVHNPERLRILDPSEPCRWASGRVAARFQANDGDWHVDLAMTAVYRHLVETDEPVIPVYFPTLTILLATTAVVFGAPYFVISAKNPRKTVLGRLIRGRYQPG